MAEDVTVGQLIEFVNKHSREQIALLEQIAKGEIARNTLQQMITQTKRSPKERLARTLLRKAQSPRVTLSIANGSPSTLVSVPSFAEIAAVYELLGEGEIADKITYQGGNAHAIYFERIKALCEKNELERARELARCLWAGDIQAFAWAAIAEKSQLETDYDQIKSTSFNARLAVAVSRAKTDQMKTLFEMRAQTEKQMGHEYLCIVAAIAKEHIRKRDFPISRSAVNALNNSMDLQFEIALALAQATKLTQDILMCRVISRRTHINHKMQHAVYLADIAAITGDEKDFAACREVIDQEGTILQHKSTAYSALALAYAEQGDIPTARDIVNKKIVVPDIEAMTLAKMARIVLSQPD